MLEAAQENARSMEIATNTERQSIENAQKLKEKCEQVEDMKQRIKEMEENHF